MKKIFLRFLSVLLAFQGYAAFQFVSIEQAHASSYEVPDVVINEIMWMGSTVSTADEWIELRNTTENSIDLTGWKLTSSAVSGATLTIPTGTIPAEGFFLVSNYDENSLNSILDVTPDYVSTAVTLNNNCLQIDLTLSDDTIVDSMGCNGTDYFYPASSSDRSAIERNTVIESGLLESSWHVSVGFANLDSSASPNNFATPSFVNDTTQPNVGIVNDSLGSDIDWATLATASAEGNWSSFEDDETKIARYTAAFGETKGGSQLSGGFVDVGLNTSHSFLTLHSLVEGVTYYVTVRAFNEVGLVREVSSDGLTVNSVDPNPVTNLTVSDVQNDEGGSVFVDWDPSTSVDEIVYRVSYKEVGGGSIVTLPATLATELVVGSLANKIDYSFTVTAVDFNLQESSSVVKVGRALDNLAPKLDITKVVVTQNKPGTVDTIRGLANASSEAATLTIFDRNPVEPVKITIASLQTNSDLSFDRQVLGDNLYGSIWLQLVDDSGNSGNAVEFSNDIVAPNAPTITRATADCKTSSCRVSLNWLDNGPDTESYQVVYSTGFNVQKSLPVKGTNLVLSLPSNGSIKDFSVQAFDKFGNASKASNSFVAAMVPGVVTSATLINGILSVKTSAVEGSRETVKATIETPPAKLVPVAQAAEETDEPEDVKVAGEQDWIRIVIVVVLLLIIAGGFYSLSRTMQNSELDIPSPEKKSEEKVKSGKKTAKEKTKSKRKNRK